MIGIVAALSCSVGLGLAVAVARFAFEGGTNGVTVAVLRASLLVVLTGVFCLVTKRDLRLPWRLWVLCFLLGLPMAVMFYANIAAVQFISIGLAALLFFTFPPLIALCEAALARRWPGGFQMVAVAVAFIGLALNNTRHSPASLCCAGLRRLFWRIRRSRRCAVLFTGTMGPPMPPQPLDWH